MADSYAILLCSLRIQLNLQCSWHFPTTADFAIRWIQTRKIHLIGNLSHCLRSTTLKQWRPTKMATKTTTIGTEKHSRLYHFVYVDHITLSTFCLCQSFSLAYLKRKSFEFHLHEYCLYRRMSRPKAAESKLFRQRIDKSFFILLVFVVKKNRQTFFFVSCRCRK